METANMRRNNGNWNIKMSTLAEKSGSIIADEINSWTANPYKSLISLETGDPLTHGNIKPSSDATNAVVQAITEGAYNGYAPSVGYESARNAIAGFLYQDGVEVETKDIIICGGCSSCLDICITALVEDTKNHNILIPNPGLPLYRNLSESLLVEARTYNLLPEKNWEVDLYDFESKIDANTAAVIINNPNNPTGAVYSANHLKEILDICFRHKIPVIADELHGQITNPNHKFVSIGSLRTRVPILICGGISQVFLVPGWRLGWIAIKDSIDAFEDVRKGLIMLSQRIVGANTFMQGALTNILHFTSQSNKEDLVNTAGENARSVCDGIRKIRGLRPYMPQGTIFMVIGIDMEFFAFKSPLEFIKKLCEEEGVKCLPLDEFGLPGYMRINLSTSNSTILDAIDRIHQFCQNHYN